MTKFNKAMHDLIMRDEFAIQAATSLDHLILHLGERQGRVGDVVATLKHHRDCMVLLQDHYKIVPRLGSGAPQAPQDH